VSDDEARTAEPNGALDRGRSKSYSKSAALPPGGSRSPPLVISLWEANLLAAVGGALWWRSQQEAARRRKQAAIAAQRLRTPRAAPALAGVTAAEIIFGISAPFSPPARSGPRA